MESEYLFGGRSLLLWTTEVTTQYLHWAASRINDVCLMFNFEQVGLELARAVMARPLERAAQLAEKIWPQGGHSANITGVFHLES